VPALAARALATARALPGRGWRRLRRTPPALAVLLVLAAAQAVAWSAITPPIHGPDELTHAAYIQALVETGDGPEGNSGTAQYSREIEIIAQGLYVLPITQHYEGRPAWHRVDEVERQLAREGDAARNPATGPNAAAGNPPLYYLYGAAVWELTPDRSLLGRLQSVRLATIVPFLVTVVLAWLLAAELFSAAWARPLVAGIVALNPKLASVAANVNPDAMLVMLSTAALLAAVRLVTRGPTAARVAVLVLAAALGVLTHGRGYFLAPFAVLALVVALWRARPPLRTALLLGGTAAAGLVAVVVLAMAWIRAHSAGAAIGSVAPSEGSFNVREFLSYVWQFYLPRYDWMTSTVGAGYGYRQMYIVTFFGSLVNLELLFSEAKHQLLQMGAFLGLAALWTAAWARWRDVRDRWPEVVLALAFFAGMVLVLHLVSYTSLKNGTGAVITGRYLLPALALAAAAVAFVATSLPRRLGVPFAGAALGLAALHAMAQLGFGVERFLA
jgi:hypothetical protein